MKYDGQNRNYKAKIRRCKLLTLRHLHPFWSYSQLAERLSIDSSVVCRDLQRLRRERLALEASSLNQANILAENGKITPTESDQAIQTVTG